MEKKVGSCGIRNTKSETKDYCLKDYRNHHFWASIGIFTRPSGKICQVFKCSQCRKIIIEELEEIKQFKEVNR